MAPRWHYVRHPDGRDTRIYDKAHIGCRTGYEYKPVWDDSMDFCFPTGSMKAARVIIFEGDEDLPESKLLLWSPNSLKRFPFFPGCRPGNYLKTPPYPFCDGHLGPFDPTRSPQYFNVKYPFLPFVRRCEHGSFPDAEEECVPVWAFWESSKEPGSEQGYVIRAYWRALQNRVQQLRAEGAKLLKEPSCHLWSGFIESYPNYPYPSDLENESRSRRFQDFVYSLAALQRDIQWLAAWVRMGQALMKRRFQRDLSVAKASFGVTQDDLMGVWVNKIPESTAAWFAECGVPLFVAHEIQGDKDRPDNYRTLLKADHPLEGSDLIGAPVLELWLSLAAGKLVSAHWDIGIDTKALLTTDMLLRWRSAPTASTSNFPGDSWYADSPASPSIKNTIPQSSFVELPGVVMEWKGLSMGSAHGASYLIPPPVQGNKQGRWEHFAQEQTLDGTSAFFLVGKKNQSLCDGLNYLFYDRTCRRILHCDGPLPIPAVVAHDTSIYGFPCPKVHFFQDNSLTRKLHASFWLYTTDYASPKDIGRSAPPPSLERVSHLQTKDKEDNAPQSTAREWTSDPIPVIIPNPSSEQKSPSNEVQTVPTVPTVPVVTVLGPPSPIPMTVPVSVSPTPPSGQGNNQKETSPVILDTLPTAEVEPRLVTSVIDTPFTFAFSSQVAKFSTEDPEQDVVDFDLTDSDVEPESRTMDVVMVDVENTDNVVIERADVGNMMDLTNQKDSELAVIDNVVPSPSTVLSLGNSSELSGSSTDSRKCCLSDRIGDQKCVKRRRFSNSKPYQTPAYRITPSRIPNAPPIYSQITPYLIVNGIGRHTIEDLRAWLDMTVPTLRVTVVIKIRSPVGGGLFIIKFYDKEEALSFKCCYNLWTSLEGDTWAIDYVSHGEVLRIPEERIIDQWHLRHGGHLNPSLDLDDPPQTRRLIRRMDVPLSDRMQDMMNPGPPLGMKDGSSGARKRRGGRFRREAQRLEGKPS